MRPLVATIIVLTVALYVGCKDNGTTVVPPKDPRTYTWVSDTIQYPGSGQTLFKSVWGVKEDLVYAVGHNASSSSGTMYWFHGASWKTTAFHVSGGGPISGSVTLGEVFGFGANSVFFSGNLSNYGSDSGLVMEYNGATWIKHFLPQDTSGYTFITIAGLSRNDLWVGGGWYPSVFHFDGVAWTREALPIAANGEEIVVVSIGMQSSDDVWASVYRNENLTGFITWFLLHRTSGPWTIVDSVRGTYPATEPPWGGHDYWRTPDGSLYSAGNGIFKLSGGTWNKILDTPFIVNDIFGTSEQRYFVVGIDGTASGQIAYGDGTSLTALTALSSSTFLYQGVWCNETDCFIVGWDGARSIVWRGT